MDWPTKFMNMVFAPIAYLSLLLIIPPYFVYKLISFIKRSIFLENVAGKVVLITGASSGIGEQLAYEYARRGARLMLAARREERLREVADKARHLGSPDVMVVSADVSKLEHCTRMVDETIKHFGQLDHLVNNAGIADGAKFDQCNVSNFIPIMDINFWGSVFCTRAAIPHLKKNKGRIIVMSSCAVWFTAPSMSFYNASKAAMMNFFETLRNEYRSVVSVTMVNPGIIESEMSRDANLSKANLEVLPVASLEESVKLIMKSICRGDNYLAVPSWVGIGLMYQTLCPEVIEWVNHINTKLASTNKD